MGGVEIHEIYLANCMGGVKVVQKKWSLCLVFWSVSFIITVFYYEGWRRLWEAPGGLGMKKAYKNLWETVVVVK